MKKGNPNAVLPIFSLCPALSAFTCHH
jgi:hypothetical protein